VRRLRRLLQKRATRHAERVFVAEGPEVVRAGLDAGIGIESLYVGAGARTRADVAELCERVLQAGSRVFDLAPGVLERVADTVTPQPLLAVFPMLDGGPEVLGAGPLAVVCTDVRDPGNAGTVLRSADAAGASAVLFTGGSVDPYNPKTVRASAGSVFHVALIVEPDVEAAMAAVKKAGYRCLGAVATDGTDYLDVDFCAPTAVVLGNEAWGIPAEAAALLDGSVTIPMAGRAESLNVGVACAVLCFEALRQQRRPGAGSAPSTMPPMSGERAE
jgi:TrmH family RNA methyltransferase